MKFLQRTYVLIGAALVGIAVTVALGCWQLDRAAQKIRLQSTIEAQGIKAPLGNSDVAALGAVDAAHLPMQQRAVLRGTWQPEATVYLDNRQMGGKVGFFVVTPLRLEGVSQWVAVQRGWVPRNFLDRQAVPAIATPLGIVTVQGRIAPAPSKLYALGTPGQGVIRQNLDLAEWSRALDHPLLSWSLLQTDPPGDGLLRAWPAVDTGVDKHYGYAAQWFGMAAVIAGLTLWFQVIRRFYFSPKDLADHV